MAIAHRPNLAETSLIKPKKFQPCPQKLPKGISLWASLLSLFIYISIFYIFDLSPSSLLNTTNFWFFISNTLILIIAADYGAYTSSRKQAELCDEDYMIRTQANSVPTFESQYKEIVKTRTPPEKVETPVQEKIKEVVVENKLQIATKSDLPMLSNEKFRERASEFTRVADDNMAREEKRNQAKCVRSLSDIAIPVANSEENNKKILRRAESEKKRADEEEEEEEEEKDEFSALSDEEVNRRVEEFIRRFNRQIRLQAAQNRIRQI